MQNNVVINGKIECVDGKYIINYSQTANKSFSLPVIFGENVQPVLGNCCVHGNVWSCSIYDAHTNKNRLMISLYVDEVLDYEEPTLFSLEGTVISTQELRVFDNNTCNTHIMIKNSFDANGKTIVSCISCIGWCALARKMSHLSIGDDVLLNGIICTRQYKKLIGNDLVDKTGYEFYVKRFTVLNNES